MTAKRTGYILFLIVILTINGCASLTPLQQAANTGDLDKVKKHLAEGAQINTGNPNPLHIAVLTDEPLAKLQTFSI